MSGKLSRVWITQEWPCPPLGACELLFAWLLTLLLPLELLLTLTLGTCAEPPPSTEGEDGELDAGTCRGGGASSLRGGMRSLMASRPLASSNEVILWVGEKPCRAAIKNLSSNKIRNLIPHQWLGLNHIAQKSSHYEFISNS